MVPGRPNLLIVMVPDVFPSEPGRGWGFDDALGGAATRTMASGEILDLSNRIHLDSIVEVAERRLTRAYVSLEAFAASCLSEAERERLHLTLALLPLKLR